MLAQVQNETVPGYLLIQREVGLKAMVPVLGEAEKILVKFFGFGYVEDTEDRNGGVEFDGHFFLFDGTCCGFDQRLATGLVCQWHPRSIIAVL